MVVCIGTPINLAASFLALVLAVQGATYAAVAVHFAPVPYNFFLFLSLWRRPDRNRMVSLLAIAWLTTMTIV
ncbi:MAG: hypothetical protein A3F78_09495 [Burkholderiales bacterium RIFCSPLOWO2_12_FULL_61_40]|nr:MAG: hypothetical protein A3F78_09495 [Burkholderiales bacterium RIFCSPLOWO2_12_FULL_61_40]